jgi:anti-sigma-K factor RskA
VKTPDFDELIGRDVDERERARLRRVHELLVEAGPPADVPASLSPPPLSGIRLRRVGASLVAAALVAAAFAGGWLARGNDDSFEIRRAVPMHGTASAPVASGSLQLGYADDHGNWPMLVTVRGLRPLPEGGYYELLLTKDGKAVATCGTFKVSTSGETTVRLGASYKLSEFDGWVVRPYVHGRDKLNQTIVLRT